jgi:transposase
MHDQLTRLLGLEGFAVTAVDEIGDHIELEVELVSPAGCCPRCGRASVEVKERPLVAVRDLPVAGRRTVLRWRKRRFRCRRCGRTFTEAHGELPPRQRVTRRFRARLFERTRAGAAHAEVARDEATSRYQVERAFALGAAGELSGRAKERLPRRLSLDEAHHRRGRGGEYATVVSDPDRRRVVEVLPGRSRRDLERYLRSLTSTEREGIEVVSIDPYDAYRLALRSELPCARIVCDPFHLVRGANEALDLIRRERQRGARSRYKRTRQGTPRQGWRQDLYHARHRLMRGRERLSERDRRTLCELFAREPLVAEAWGLKEAFRGIYRSADRTEAEARLQHFLAAVERAALPSFDSFARAVRLWREELLAYFEEPVTNGYAEGVINKVKVIKRRAYGLPSFQGFRRRVLVACG